MLPTLTPQEFVSKWSKASLKERSAAQEHFIDLCRLVGHPTPAEADPMGTTFTFEAGATRASGGQGWADVWKRGCFAWEYKGKHKDLDRAYQQLLQYRESLLNPPLLIVSDLDRILIHTNFTNTIKRVIALHLDDLLQPTGLAQLRAVFTTPQSFRAPVTTEQVTEEAAGHFARLAGALRQSGAEPEAAAHFLIRLLFCLFSEDIGLLPKELFTRLIRQTQKHPDAFAAQLRQLFGAMSTGGWFGADQVPHFDGRLFDDDTALHLDRECLDILAQVASLDWASIEPSVFGTLFERSLDPAKRAQLGAHFTSREDILLIVEPVLMGPLREGWDKVREKAVQLARRRDEADTKRKRDTRQKEIAALLLDFAADIAQIRVLDPACGSGNFLYVALRQLLDLWKEVSLLARELGLPAISPLPTIAPSPLQLHGIEINPYAHQLAQATIWIGYIQWLHENGFGIPSAPILKPLDTILQMDAILAYDEDGRPVEPEWPAADVIIGNPPFLGGNKIRKELGDSYVDDLFALYYGRVPAFADLVCYWFDKARSAIKGNRDRRAGLLATQAIRGGANRRVLERVKETGDIFWAESDRDWILDGATVHVSMVGFDNGIEKSRVLDGHHVSGIFADLSSVANLPAAQRLAENRHICCYGSQQKGSFNIPPELAQQFLTAVNPFGHDNSDVVRRSANGRHLLQGGPPNWVIDFGVRTPIEQASLYEGPFEYIKQVVYPERKHRREKIQREWWWLHARPSPRYREFMRELDRSIATPAVAKHHVFVWLDQTVLADHALIVFGRDDDLFFGALHSRLHELWARCQGTQLRDAKSGRRYTPTTVFETFPFPWPPGREPEDDPRVEAIAKAARELVKKREAWLNPPRATEKELKKRTLTNLYNQRPTWLDLAHRKLDAAVLDAYGWPHDLTDEQILEHLLALNLERAGQQEEKG